MARRIIREILRTGTVVFTDHARTELGKDALVERDITNVLRGGVVDPAEWENGAWRYRVRTQRIEVIVEFESRDGLIVITAWKRRMR
ncbi:MAG: hypothetical protein DRJ42_00610 [Deltaproteobacteria bacterium]|nr:MAG: hypothetical protein DRJ42_00610 [Deltaproteobacteria bacterium]